MYSLYTNSTWITVKGESPSILFFKLLTKACNVTLCNKQVLLNSCLLSSDILFVYLMNMFQSMPMFSTVLRSSGTVLNTKNMYLPGV